MATYEERISYRDREDDSRRSTASRRRSPFREERRSRRRSRSRSFSPPRRRHSPGRRRVEEEPARPVSYPTRPKELTAEDKEKLTSEPMPEQPAKKKKEDNPLLMRTGGAYIPPARLRMMQQQITDKNSEPYQRLAWEALKKSINGLVNKVNVSNIANIVRELFQENIVRGRGLLGRSIVTAQAASPTFTHVYAALVAILNTKFPQIGELIIKRVIVNFKKGYRRNDKNLCMASANFLAHFVNQQVVHELIALEILTLLLENPTDDSVEVAIGFLKECGLKLSQVAPKGMHGVYDSLRGILNDGKLDVRVQYMIEVMFAIRKDGFKEHPVVIEQLDLVEEDDQITHFVTIEEQCDPEDYLNVFKFDPEYLINEDKYKQIRDDVLGGGGSDSESSSSGEEDSDDDDNDEGNEEEDGEMKIQDETQMNTMTLRRTIYLTIMSSLSFEECAHKMLQMTIKPGQEIRRTIYLTIMSSLSFEECAHKMLQMTIKPGQEIRCTIYLTIMSSLSFEECAHKMLQMTIKPGQEIRRTIYLTIYLTIMSSLIFEECAHKMLQMTIKPGQEYDVGSMIIECCSQERSYRKFFGLLGQRFCQLNPEYVEQYVKLFQEHYSTCHRLETNKLRNVSKFFAHLCYTDALPWSCLSIIHLNEEETTSSSRIFIKILFQELAEYMGLVKLNERLRDPFLAQAFEGLMPRDNPRNTRFSINFFTSIGLGGLTDDLREHLKATSKMIVSQKHDSESSDSSSSEEEQLLSSSTSSSEEEEKVKSKHKRDKKKRKTEKKKSKQHKRSKKSDR